MESQHDLAGGLASKERERASFPRVEGGIEVVSLISDPLDDQLPRCSLVAGDDTAPVRWRCPDRVPPG